MFDLHHHLVLIPKWSPSDEPIHVSTGRSTGYIPGSVDLDGKHDETDKERVWNMTSGRAL